MRRNNTVDTIRTMLIVDDSRIDRTLLAKIFTGHYAVEQACDGREALDVLRRKKIDIVVLDISMADMDGFEVIHAMRSDPTLSDIPIVVATSEPAHEEAALSDGADDFIAKPFNPVIVKKRVENIIVKHMLERERLENALHETELELRSLADTVPGGIGVFTLTNQGCLSLGYFNDSFHELFGRTRSQMATQFSDDILQLVFADDRAQVLASLQKSEASGERFDTTFRIVLPDGALRWVSASAVEYKRTDDQPVFRSVIIDITESKENELLAKQRARELQYAAEHDQLTGLYNRAAFCRKTAEYLAAHKDAEHVIIQFDIERFKIINELYGSDKGDEVLLAIAGALMRHVDGNGVYGRMETDHFALCLPANDEVIKSCMASISDSLAVTGIDRQIILYYGVYRIVDRTMPVDIMCDRANLALRSVKGDYNKRYAVYDASMHQLVLNEHELRSEGDQALRDRQFEAFLQPIFNLGDGRLASAEALVRWRHPEKGLVPPGQFIPFFENSGFIVRLDSYIRESVCELMVHMDEGGLACPPVSVNVSRLEFYDPKLCQNLRELLRFYKLDPSRLRLEITESAYADNATQLLEAMDELQGLGFVMLMDDFGAGFSSLSMLRDVPVDMIKLDMRFLSHGATLDRERGILSAIVPMAKSLGLPVIAEGVETGEQAEFLKSIGCDYVQGFHFARPMPQDDFRALVGKAGRVAACGGVREGGR